MWKPFVALAAACVVMPAFAADAVAPPGTCVSPAVFQDALDFMGDWTLFRDPPGPVSAGTRAIVFRDLKGAVVLRRAQPDRRV